MRRWLKVSVCPRSLAVLPAEPFEQLVGVTSAVLGGSGLRLLGCALSSLNARPPPRTSVNVSSSSTPRTRLPQPRRRPKGKFLSRRLLYPVELPLIWKSAVPMSGFRAITTGMQEMTLTENAGLSNTIKKLNRDAMKAKCHIVALHSEIIIQDTSVFLRLGAIFILWKIRWFCPRISGTNFIWEREIFELNGGKGYLSRLFKGLLEVQLISRSHGDGEYRVTTVYMQDWWSVGGESGVATPLQLWSEMDLPQN